MTRPNVALDLPRWAQLTYTSFDDGVRAGGWHIKQSDGEISEQESEYLRTRVSTRFELVEPLPEFPLADEIAALPRRLVYLRTEPDTAGFWHSSPAGSDATGRPGNVFAHMVLDRRPDDATDQRRPVELWASPDWLCPYGADETLAAQLHSAGLPRVGATITRERIISFLLDPEHWRIGTLCALLDAVAAALAGGPPVALGVSTPDEGATWIGAVSYLMSAQHARRLGFSTFERGETLADHWPQGLHLAAVPPVDLALLEDAACCVIDTAGAVTLGVAGGEPHSTDRGSTIPVTGWSNLAEVALQTEQIAIRTLVDLDRVTAAVDDSSAAPHWALAAALREYRDEFAYIDAELSDALASGDAVDLSANVDLAQAVRHEVRTAIGSSAAAAWDAVARSPRSGVQAAARTYLQLALRDADWLDGEEPAPVPEPTVLSEDERTELTASLLARLDELFVVVDGQEVHEVLLSRSILRLADFAIRAGVIDASPPRRDSPGEVLAIQELVEKVAVGALMSRYGPDLVRFVGKLDPRTSAAIVQPALEARLKDRPGSNPVGKRFEPGVVGWVFGYIVPAVEPGQLDGDRSHLSPLHSELLAAFVLQNPSSLSARRGLLPDVLRDALAHPDSAAYRGLVAQLVDEHVEANDLLDLLRDFGPALPGRFLIAPVRSLPWHDPFLQALVDELRIRTATSHDPDTDLALRIATVRQLVHDLPVTASLTAATTLVTSLETAGSSTVAAFAALGPEFATASIAAITLVALSEGRVTIDLPVSDTASPGRGGESRPPEPPPLVTGTRAMVGVDWQSPQAASPASGYGPLPSSASQAGTSNVRHEWFWSWLDDLAHRADLNGVVEICRLGFSTRQFDAPTAIAALLFADPQCPVAGELARPQSQLRVAAFVINGQANPFHAVVVRLSTSGELRADGRYIDAVAEGVVRAVNRPTDYLRTEAKQWARERWKDLAGRSRGRRLTRGS